MARKSKPASPFGSYLRGFIHSGLFTGLLSGGFYIHALHTGEIEVVKDTPFWEIAATIAALII